MGGSAQRRETAGRQGGQRAQRCPAGQCPAPPATASLPAATAGVQTGEGTYPARVVLQELDFLEELDVVGAQAVQLTLQGLDGVLGHAVLLWAGSGGWAAGPAGRGGERPPCWQGYCSATCSRFDLLRPFSGSGECPFSSCDLASGRSQSS